MSETTKRERSLFWPFLDQVAQTMSERSPLGPAFSGFLARIFRDADRLERLESEPNAELVGLRALAENIRGMAPYEPGEVPIQRPYYDAATIDALVETLAPETSP